MNVTNATSAELEAMMAAARAVYSVGVPAMMVVCVCAIAVNGRCLAAIGWLRGQLSPTLLLSLSLAAADLHVSLLLLLSLVLNSYLPVVWAVVPARSACPQLALEALRLGGVLTLVAHLTALALNHHLGIIRPLRYPGIATGRNIRILLGVIWSVPPAGFLLYMFVPEGFLDECSGNSQFLEWFSFRVAFSALLVGPLAMMCCTYAHILWTVHVQTREWARGGATGGSYKHRGGKRSARSADPTGCAPANKQRSLMVSVRAVYTTMHILGSFVLLYLPAIVSFMLVCPQGCRYHFYC